MASDPRINVTMRATWNVEVTIHTVDAHGVASVRATGRMDVEQDVTRAEALGTLTAFLDEMKELHLPHDDRRFLVVSAHFPVHGDLAVTGLGVEVEAAEE
jgi:hypothetical protein